MNQRTRKAEEHKTQAAAEKAVQKKANAPTLQDNRPEAMAQRQLQESADKHQSTTTTPLQAKLVSAAPNMTQLRQNKEEKAIQKKNKTGMPDELKSGIEQLSGHSMDDVKVHYNSAQPKQLQAHAYAQGSNIHLGPGQEKHLPHEAWHVVQQKQGRVKPTLQMKSIAVNDDAGLEKEADNMGAKAVSLKAMEGPEADLATTSLSAGTVQRVKIILDPGTKKYREIKPSEQKAEGIIDTATIPALQREGIISHIKDNDKSSALLRKIQAETGSMAEAYSLEKLTELEPRISELEQKESAAKEAGLSEPDKKLLPPLAEELQKAAAAMGSIADQDFRQLFNAYYARFTQLKAVKADPKLKIVAKNHEDIAVDTTVDAATRRAYRDDTKTLGTWGGLSEAQQVALYFHKTVTIFRIDHEGTYRQVTTVGGGPAAQVGLLFLGNHYEAIRGAVDGNEATEGERRYETVPDGNCMYEAMWIACHNGLKPTPEQRLKYLKHVRAHVASHLTADVIDQNVQSAIVLGDQAGMGSKMREKLREKTNTAKWGHYTDGTLDKLKTDLKEGKESDLAQLDTAITAFKANRNQVDKDAKAAALDGLEVAIAKVRNGIHQKKWALSGGSITLNMDWWNTLQSASRANSENMKDFELARKLGIDYNQHAQEKVVPEADTKAGAAYHLHVQKLLAELDKLEELGKTLYGIEGGPVAAIFGESAEQQALAKLARAKLYEFATYSIRTTRAALIHSYHMQNKPEQRVGAGNRPDMHHAVYANNEPESGDQRKTPVPAGYEKEIQALVARSNKADKSGKAGKPGSKGGTARPHKTQSNRPKKP